MGFPASQPNPFSGPAFFPRLFRALGRSHFRCRVIDRSAGWPVLEILKCAPDRPVLYLSAGIHGDEPAGPLALLALLESGELANARCGFAIYPALNPGGLEAATREGPEGVDYNRFYHDRTETCPRPVDRHRAAIEAASTPESFAAALCLHEDWESGGGYLYELNPDGQPPAAPAILEAFDRTCGVESAETIDGWPTRGPGLIQTPDHPEERPVWPEAIFLIATRTRYCLTTETPSAAPVERRIAAQIEAIRILLDQIQKAH